MQKGEKPLHLRIFDGYIISFCDTRDECHWEASWWVKWEDVDRMLIFMDLNQIDVIENIGQIELLKKVGFVRSLLPF